MSPQRILVALVALVLAVAGQLAAMPAAQATTGREVATVTNHVQFDGDTCVAPRVTVYPVVARESYTFTVTDPRGQTVATVTTSSADSDMLSFDVSICPGAHPAGRYAISIPDGEIGSFTVVDATATAAGTGTEVQYLKNACYLSQIDVTGLNPDAEYDVAVLNPRGAVVAVQELWNGGVSETHFTAKLCPTKKPAGRYRITAGAPENTKHRVEIGSFTVRQPSLTLVRTSKRTMAVRVKIAGQPLVGRQVVFQGAYGGTHYDLITLTTNKYGLVAVSCSTGYRCPETYRYAYQGFAFSSHFHLYAGSAKARLAANQRGIAAIAAR